MFIRFIKGFCKSLFAPKEIEMRTSYSSSVYCPFCDWQGTVDESLQKDICNDTCPRCGATQLVYYLK